MLSNLGSMVHLRTTRSLRALIVWATAACLVGIVGPVSGAPSRLVGKRFARAVTVALPGPGRTGAELAAAPIQLECTGGSRGATDRPDVYSGPMVHIVYLVPADAADESFDVNGTLECSIRGQNDWMRAQTGLEWRFDTYIDGRGREMVDVSFVRSARPASQLSGATAVRSELQLLGFEVADKRYLSYVASGAGQGTCGDAFYPLVQEESIPVDGKYAQVYLNSADGCHARDFGSPTNPSWSEAIAQQELIHNDAMTPIGAPHSCGNNLPFAHVCTGPLWATEGVLNLDPERVDVMFPYVSGPLSGKVMDRGHDDYFRHPLPLIDLENSPYLRVPGSEKPSGSPQPVPTPGSSPSPGPGPTPYPSPTGSPGPTPSPQPFTRADAGRPEGRSQPQTDLRRHAGRSR